MLQRGISLLCFRPACRVPVLASASLLPSATSPCSPLAAVRGRSLSTPTSDKASGHGSRPPTQRDWKPAIAIFGAVVALTYYTYKSIRERIYEASVDFVLSNSQVIALMGSPVQADHGSLVHLSGWRRPSDSPDENDQGSRTASGCPTTSTGRTPPAKCGAWPDVWAPAGSRGGSSRS
eukprot:TRINITY_DN11287_c0_g1_i2.p1 TRINITY_DN11287_c0_g1~~TRINITY_DN11287_c0_g1_i2.p1  ORF type:complete len:178 (-),score=3.20 TRINITY_DN11287_c0_g1_i2:90-623(-)